MKQAAAKAPLAFALALALALAGCLGGDEPTEALALDNASVADGEAALDLNATSNGTATTPDDLTGGQSPHLHNYWGDKEQVTLFDDVVDVRVFSGATFYNVFNRRAAELGGAWWELPEGATVYEGTGKVVLTASWTDPAITGLAAAWKHANQPWDGQTFATTTPLTNGQPFEIEVTPDMTDMPHDAVSRWAFYFSASGTPGVAQGEMHLKVDIVRMRDIGLFPGHPDMYEDTELYVLADKDFQYKSPSFITEIASFATGGSGGEDGLAPDSPVPMETELLIVEITLAEGSAGTPLAEQNGLDLRYRSAGGTWDWLQPMNETGGVYTFAVPVEEGDYDSPYGEYSNWRFFPMLRSSTDLAGIGDIGGCGGCFDQEFQGHLKVTSYDEDPSGLLDDDEDDAR